MYAWGFDYNFTNYHFRKPLMFTPLASVVLKSQGFF